ncbi:hypothetical protein ACH5RR_032542 [Cinchona calisaya]|uniref:CRIB domain-containing protein n=1 Tax=Cinchona calisaya TaxID=153742 RepID=A0ABD2YML4_9GENT
MRDHKGRLVLLPFSMGCGSASRVAVGNCNHPKNQKHLPQKILLPPPTRRKDEKESKSTAKVRSIRTLLSVPKYGLSWGVNKLTKSFKRFSQLLVYEDEDKDEEMEREIEIGLPTDVKHITHIGWDGSTAINPIKGWENFEAPEILSLSSISLKQFELAMAAQACAQPIAYRCW